MPDSHSKLVELIDRLNISGNSLAASTGVIGLSARIDVAKAQGFRTVQQEGVLEFNASDGSGGPVLVGFCSVSLSLAQIEEKIEADPEGMEDTEPMEQVRRRIYWLGFLQPSAGGGNVGAIHAFKKTHKVSFIEGEGMQYFVYNTDPTGALDAANTIKITCKHLGVWLRD